MPTPAGLLLCAAWYYTILAGFYTLYCPVVYLMFFNHKLYRRIVDFLFALWELYPVALFQGCFGNTVHHFGDFVDPDEKTIIVINHRTRLDWNYAWIGLYHATQRACEDDCICKEKYNRLPQDDHTSLVDLGGKAKLKYVLKDQIKNIPGLGWIMQLNYFLYVKRNWREDQAGLSQFVDYYARLPAACRLLLFPEGTDLSAANKQRSHQYAASHNLPPYDYVLHPRTTGFVELCARMRRAGLASVYDVTVAYDHPAESELDLLRGALPHHAYFHFKRYPINDLPTEEDDLRRWLNSRWHEKEGSLRKFHMDGTFLDPVTNRAPPERSPRPLGNAMLGFLFWTSIDILFMYALLNNAFVQFWVIYHSLLFAFVTSYFNGFHNIQYKLLENSKSL